MEYSWAMATLNDVDDIVKLCEDNYRADNLNQSGQDIFTPEPAVYSRNLAYAILNQTYYPGSEILTVARRDDNNRLLAYNWAKSGDRIWYSDDQMVNVRMVHIDLTLSARTRVQLVKDMMNHWERLARFSKNTVICNSTIRFDQTAFLRLHEREGYSVRGSFCYKKLT